MRHPCGRALPDRRQREHHRLLKDRAAVRLAIAGLVFLTVMRVGVALVRTGPLVVADELGYLTDARVLTGGPVGDIGSAEIYRGGYALVIAPVIGLIHDPTTAYHLVLVVNAGLALILAALLFVMLRRTFHVATGPAALAAAAAGIFPSVTFQAELAMSENLLMPLLVGWVICLGELARPGSATRHTAWAIAAAACASLLVAAHGRMLVALVITAALLIWLAARGQIAAGPAIVGLGVLGAGFLLANRLTQYLIDGNYGGRQPNEIGPRLDNLRNARGIASVLRNLVGQTWYALVASLGVVLLVVVMERRRLLARFTTRSPAGVALVTLVASAAGLLLLSALSFGDPTRPDMLIYGRYVEVVLPPLIALALVRLSAGRGSRADLLTTVSAMLALTAVVAILRTTVDLPGSASRFNVAALPGITRNLEPIILMLAGGVAAFALVAAWAAARRRPWLVAPAIALLFLPTTGYALRDPLWTTERQVFREGWKDPAHAAAGVAIIGYDTDHIDGVGEFVTQWFLPDARFVTFSGSSEPPPARYLISSGAWNAEHPGRHGTILWSYRERQQYLWRLDR
jgi:hypothetical protein